LRSSIDFRRRIGLFISCATILRESKTHTIIGSLQRWFLSKYLSDPWSPESSLSTVLLDFDTRSVVETEMRSVFGISVHFFSFSLAIIYCCPVSNAYK
jgi:hypothetical protein